jgi:hypothetical protein
MSRNQEWPNIDFVDRIPQIMIQSEGSWIAKSNNKLEIQKFVQR